MVVLDATVVNVALPSIQTDLGFTAANLQWVINAYTLVFGGFLLLGGRAGDLFGRRRLFLAGVAIFSVASLLNGLATSEDVAGRRPRAAGPRRRARLPRRAVDHHHDVRRGRGADEGARRLERDRRGRRRVRPAARRHPHRPAELGVDLLRQRADRHRHRGARASATCPSRARRTATDSVDLPGAVTRHRRPVVLVYAIVKAEDYGWGSARTLGLAAVAVALLVAFVLIERRTKAPLIRLGIFRVRSLAGANADAAARDRRPVRVLLLLARSTSSRSSATRRSRPASRSCR